MNYLAHAYLSFRQPGILVGNMISDFVKGKMQYAYSPAIFKGIKLHRAIDAFTDGHEATRQAKEFFRKDYRLYAGAFVDVVYDHYLATDKRIFPDIESLQLEVNFAYQILQQHKELLPERFKMMLPFMESQNWLFNYQFRWGIERSLMGVVRRSAYLTESAIAFAIFETHYKELQQCYHVFLPDLKEMAERFILNWQEE